MKLSKSNFGGLLSLIFWPLMVAWVLGGPLPSYVFVGCSVGVGAILLWRSSSGRRPEYVVAYLSFVICLWLFSPFIRRLGDYRNGWSDLNVYGLAPMLVTLLAILAINRDFKALPRTMFLASLMVASLVYALLIGIVKNGLAPAAYSFLTWLCPVVIMIYLCSNFRHIKEIERGITTTFTISLLILSSYGIFQYFFLPAWDLLWIINVEMTSVGLPFPTQFRVFSTSNSPMVFAPILVMIMLFLLAKKGWLTYSGLFFSVVVLGLTYVRAAWLGLAVGLAWYIFWLFKRDFKSFARLSLTMLGISLAFAAWMGGEVGEQLTERVTSVFDLEGDTSFNERLYFYFDTFAYAMSNVAGDGMGAVGRAQALADSNNVDMVFDSGLLQFPIVLGWFGAFLYVVPLLYLIQKEIVQSRRPEVVCLVAIAVSNMVQLVFSNRLIGVIGFFVYLFLGLLLASNLNKNRGTRG